MPRRLIHIVPQLPPNLNGVGDYAVILGRRVAEQTGGQITSSYVQAGGKDNDAPRGDLNSTDLAGQQSVEMLTKVIGTRAEEVEPEATVLLHYVGYGYQQRGCPLWLVRALRRLKSEWPMSTVTMFHELYATSRKPWTSAFWSSPVQRYLTAQLAGLSDGIMTNLQASAEKLRAMTDAKTPIRVSPTFSNVGEPAKLPSYEEREPYAVVFGGAERKAATYRQHGAAMDGVLRRMGTERIVDIGSLVQDDAADTLQLPVESKGVLPVEEVSAHLRRASVGVLRYPLHCLTKSGLWASYAAHGVPTILIAERHPAETLEEGQHFMLLDALTGDIPDESQRGSMSREIKLWYDDQGHSRCASQALAVLLNRTQVGQPSTTNMS